MKWKVKPLHTVSDWVIAEYEDRTIEYEYSAEAEGGLQPKDGLAPFLRSGQHLIEEASLISRRCRFDDGHESTSTTAGRDMLTIRCKFFMWFWHPSALRREDFVKYNVQRRQLRRLLLQSLRQSFSDTLNSSNISLRMLPSCQRQHEPWYHHCELPQAPFTAGPLVGFYSDMSRPTLTREELEQLPPFSAPQLVTWAYRPLDHLLRRRARREFSMPRPKEHNSISSEIAHLHETHLTQKREQ